MMRDIWTNDNYSSDNPAYSERFDLDSANQERDTTLAEEMFERFLYPQRDEYLSLNCGNTDDILHHRCYTIDDLHPLPTEELRQKTIALVLEALEVAEAVLFAKLSATILDNKRLDI